MRVGVLGSITEHSFNHYDSHRFQRVNNGQSWLKKVYTIPISAQNPLSDTPSHVLYLKMLDPTPLYAAGIQFMLRHPKACILRILKRPRSPQQRPQPKLARPMAHVETMIHWC